MTKEEAILNAVYFCNMCNCHDEVVPILENIIQENTKLKADIEDLYNQISCKDMIIEELETEKNNYFADLCKEREFGKAEIEQLKEDSKIVAKELVTQIREIEQLKIDYKDEANMVNEYTEIMVSQRKEIEQLKSELERYKKLIPKMCENCEYEDLLGYEEPCERCFLYSKWKLKCEVSND